MSRALRTLYYKPRAYFLAYILEKNVNVNAFRFHGMPLVHEYVREAHYHSVEELETLLEAGADPTIMWGGESAMAYAFGMLFDDEAAVRLARGRDLSKEAEKIWEVLVELMQYGRMHVLWEMDGCRHPTLLHLLLREKETWYEEEENHMAAVFIDKFRQDPNQRNDAGETPLHIAAAYRGGERACKGSIAMIELLLSRGADPSLRDAEGRTSLDVARPHAATWMRQRMALKAGVAAAFLIVARRRGLDAEMVRRLILMAWVPWWPMARRGFQFI